MCINAVVNMAPLLVTIGIISQLVVPEIKLVCCIGSKLVYFFNYHTTSGFRTHVWTSSVLLLKFLC